MSRGRIGAVVPTLVIACVCSWATATEAPSATAISPTSLAKPMGKWKANGSQGIWIGVAGGRWLYAAFQKPCADLPSSVAAQFRWSLSADLRVGASVTTSSGSVCAVSHVDEVAGAGSFAPIKGKDGESDPPGLEGVTVEGRVAQSPAGSREIPQCGVRAIVWSLTRPGSAWRLITPVEDAGPATACLAPGVAGDGAGSAASGYRWSPGTAP
jgi:hypothetical protein